MPICPGCGFDVEKEGSCRECRLKYSEFKRKGKNAEAPGKYRSLLLLIVSFLAFGASAFLLGRMSTTATQVASIPTFRETVSGLPMAGLSDHTPIQARRHGSESPGTWQDPTIDLPPPAHDLRQRIDAPPLQDEKAFLQWTLARTPQTEHYITWRWGLAQSLKSSGDISTDRVMEAFLRTPRENFCRTRNLKRAYDDVFLSIGYGVTISDPNVVCRMTETIAPTAEQKVLEIGTGSGYQSAILAELSNYVYTIEVIAALAEETDQLYTQFEKDYPEYKNIMRKNNDGYYGWPEYEPFDRIIVTCGIDHIPPPLLQQLAPGGIMVIPVGPRGRQTLLKVTKHSLRDGSEVVTREDVYKGQMKVNFVPLTTKSGKAHSLKDAVDSR